MVRNVSLRTFAGLVAFAIAAAPTFARATPPSSASTMPGAATADVASPAAPTPAPPSPATQPAVPVAATSPAPSNPHLPAYIAGGLAVVAAGVGVAFGVLALNAKSDFERSPTLSGADSGNNYAAYCDASLGAALLAGATSVVLFLAEENPHPDPVAARADAPKQSAVTFTASPILVPHGAGAGAVLRF